jgi:N-acetylmuramoyl-L-alanine amidase
MEAGSVNRIVVLSENGFFSNPDERALMSTKQFKTKIAYAHYVVICQIEEIKPIPIELWM